MATSWPTSPFLSNQAGVVTRHPVPDSSSVQGYYLSTEYHLTTAQYVPKAPNHPPDGVNSIGVSDTYRPQACATSSPQSRLSVLEDDDLTATQRDPVQR